jgi:hypothetical protein
MTREDTIKLVYEKQFLRIWNGLNWLKLIGDPRIRYECTVIRVFCE